MTCCMKAGDPGSVVLQGIISQPVTTPLLSRRRRSTIIAPDTKTPEWSSGLLFFLFSFSFFNKRHQGNVSDATRQGLANTPRGGGGGGLYRRSCYTDSVETTWRGMTPVRAVAASSALPSETLGTWRRICHFYCFYDIEYFNIYLCGTNLRQYSLHPKKHFRLCWY